MNHALKIILGALFLITTNLVHAQSTGSHPNMSSTFTAAVGAFRSDSRFKLSAQGVDLDLDDEIDFGDSVGVDESVTLLNAQLRWKFGNEKKWSLWGQYFKNSSKGERTLDEDVSWDDVIFREGTFVDGGVSIEVIRLFFGRSFVKNEHHDFGAGLGIHNLDIGAFIGGEILVNDETTGYERVEESGSQILPNLGAWYNFSPAERWLIHARLDWISANVGNYDGSLWNTSIGVNYQPFDHVGFDLSYQYFELDVSVDKTDWVGNANLSYAGPVLGMTFTW